MKVDINYRDIKDIKEWDAKSNQIFLFNII